MLSAKERTLLVDEFVFADNDVEEPIRKTPVDDPVQLTLDDWDELAGAVAAEANHCSDSKQAKRLYKIFGRIGELLEAYTDEPAKDDSRDDAVTVAEGVSLLLATAKLAGIEPDAVNATMQLSGEDQMILLNLLDANESIGKKLRGIKGQDAVVLSCSELASICFTIANRMVDAHAELREWLRDIATRIVTSLTVCLSVAAADKRERRIERRRSKRRVQDGQISLQLTEVQRHALKVLTPAFVPRLKLDEPSGRTIKFTEEELKTIRAAVRTAEAKRTPGIKAHSLSCINARVDEALE